MSTSGKRINYEMLLRNAPSLQRRRNESIENCLGRITHLNLNEKGIERIENLEVCINLKVLYLYDNSICEIDNLHFARNLTHLYLQNNQITVMDGLPTTSLQKLYLDGNHIQILAGLEHANCLQELHLSNQKLDKGVPMVLDPQSCGALSPTLTVLNISGNQLTEESINEVMRLVRLEKLNISKNNIQDINAVLALLSLYSLMELDTRGNPVCRAPKYDQTTVAQSSPRLKKIDNKEVNPRQRQMLISLQAHRRKAKTSRVSSRAMSDLSLDSKATAVSIDSARKGESKDLVRTGSLRSSTKGGGGGNDGSIPMSAHFDVVDVGGLPFKEDAAAASAQPASSAPEAKGRLGPSTQQTYLRKGSGIKPPLSRPKKYSGSR